MGETSRISTVEKLMWKMEQEFENHKVELRRMEPERIITKSYETAIKKELLDLAANREFIEGREAKALLAEKYPLDVLYQDWIEAGHLSFEEPLSISIDESLERVVKFYDRNQKER